MRLAKYIVLCACVFTLMTACGRIEKGERMTTESTETNQFTKDGNGRGQWHKAQRISVK